MAIPPRGILIDATFQALKSLGGLAHIKDIDTKVAEVLGLCEEDINEIHEGSRTRLAYETAWARFYLKNFELIEKVSRGVWALTPEGVIKPSVNSQEIINSYSSQNSVEIEKVVSEDLDDALLREEGNPDVEKEVEDTITIIKEPFDPKQIDIKSKQMMLKALFERLQFDEIDLFTDFQRQGDLWDITKQSRLIESILIRFPLPAFYFDGTDDNKWLIVDGLQRISALKNFVIDKTFKGSAFKLTNLEFLVNAEGCTYEDLPRDLKRRIDETEITIYVISPGTPEKVKYNLFKRINTSGLILEPQEIRHALNQGVPATFIKELAELEEFRRATSYSIRTHRMLDRDFVTRYVSFYLIGYKNYEPDLDSFLNKGMSLIKSLNHDELDKMKIDFKKAMRGCLSIFDKYAFRKRYYENETRKPINKALFEVWSVALARLSQERVDLLTQKKSEVNNKFMALLNNDKMFEKAISSTTGDKGRVIKRFSEIENLLKAI